MFDFHLHSSVSFDSECPAEKIVKKAEEIGLKEICFTDHYDFLSNPQKEFHLFSLEQYNHYDKLSSEKLKIRKGAEFGLTYWNKQELNKLLECRNFDFIIGSLHYIDCFDPYNEPFWEHYSCSQALEMYFNEVLKCVKIHDGFDVLGHLTYILKCPPNPEKSPLPYAQYADITDEIFKELIKKGIGLEVNTSGIDTAKIFLPDKDFLKRFKELGGEIITVGSDSHNEIRVGQYTKEALEMLKDIFGYVCTFENRKPIFHKL